MTGKDKCKILRDIRRRIAEENDIELVTKECEHKGTCRGTCPKCEAELRYLERSLARRRALGQRVTVAALALGVTATMTACRLPEIHIKDGGELEGDVPMVTPEPTDEPVILDGDVAYIPDDGYELDGDVEDQPLEGETSLPDDGYELEGEPAVDEYGTIIGREPDAHIPETPTPVVPKAEDGAEG
jgi:hypothetical protein